MSFRITGLPAATGAHLIGLPDSELSKHDAVRMTATAVPGFPCRVTLKDAAIGETLILMPYTHQPADGPYHASGPIFVREAARDPYDRVDEIPEQLRSRPLSVRAYDTNHMMQDADVVDGLKVEEAIGRFFSNPGTTYLHVHFAKRGCFACKVTRT